MKLESGEVICDKCNGEIFVDNDNGIDICSKCLGSGKLDWIEKIVGKKPPLIWGQRTTALLNNINIRKMLIYIEKNIKDIIEYHIFEIIDERTMNSIKGMSDAILEVLKSKNILYDFKIDYIPLENIKIAYKLGVLIRPNRTVEYINMEFDIIKRDTYGET